MLIVCPACASAYEIDADHVGTEGRSVRCAACRETWFVSPDDAASAGDAVTESLEASHADVFAVGAFEAGSGETVEPAGPVVDQPLPYPRAAKRPVPPPKRFPVPSAALIAGLIVFVAIPLALLGRNTVVRAMPQSAGLFAMLGLPVNLRGVELRDVVAFQTPAEDGKPAQLVVEGDLVGVARDRVDVPAIAVEVRDAHDQPLYRWTVSAPRAALETAETARFHASLSAPPAQGRSIDVRFAEAGNRPETTGEPAKASATESAKRTAADNADHTSHADHGH